MLLSSTVSVYSIFDVTPLEINHSEGQLEYDTHQLNTELTRFHLPVTLSAHSDSAFPSMAEMTSAS